MRSKNKQCLTHTHNMMDIKHTNSHKYNYHFFHPIPSYTHPQLLDGWVTSGRKACTSFLIAVYMTVITGVITGGSLESLI